MGRPPSRPRSASAPLRNPRPHPETTQFSLQARIYKITSCKKPSLIALPLQVSRPLVPPSSCSLETRMLDPSEGPEGGLQLQRDADSRAGKEPTGPWGKCREATLHQRPAWQEASDVCSSGSAVPPNPRRPGAGQEKEETFAGLLSQPNAQTPISRPHVPDVRDPAAGPWHLPFPLPNHPLPPCLLSEGLSRYSGLCPDAPLHRGLPCPPPLDS